MCTTNVHINKYPDTETMTNRGTSESCLFDGSIFATINHISKEG